QRVLSMGTTTARIGFWPPFSLLNSSNNRNSSPSFSSRAKEKNMMEGDPPDSEGNQFPINRFPRSRYPEISDPLKRSTPAFLKSCSSSSLYWPTEVTTIIFILFVIFAFDHIIYQGHDEQGQYR